MTRSISRRLAPAVAASFALLALTATAMAQDPAPAPVSDPSDYRWAVYTSCTVAFAAILVYLVVTHSRAAGVADDIRRLERRLDDFEGGAK